MYTSTKVRCIPQWVLHPQYYSRPSRATFNVCNVPYALPIPEKIYARWWTLAGTSTVVTE